jgi:hypothetical protein
VIIVNNLESSVFTISHPIVSFSVVVVVVVEIDDLSMLAAWSSFQEEREEGSEGQSKDYIAAWRGSACIQAKRGLSRASCLEDAPRQGFHACTSTRIGREQT